jgi:hypothetical protein
MPLLGGCKRERRPRVQGCRWAVERSGAPGGATGKTRQWPLFGCPGRRTGYAGTRTGRAGTGHH